MAEYKPVFPIPSGKEPDPWQGTPDLAKMLAVGIALGMTPIPPSPRRPIWPWFILGLFALSTLLMVGCPVQAAPTPLVKAATARPPSPPPGVHRLRWRTTTYPRVTFYAGGRYHIWADACDMPFWEGFYRVEGDTLHLLEARCCAGACWSQYEFALYPGRWNGPDFELLP